MMGGIGVVEWRSLCRVDRIRLMEGSLFGGLGRRAPVHDARGPEL
jgi:hypothetical protein